VPFPERDELFARYQRLIRPIAVSIGRKCPPDVHREDLEQVGAVGLLAACADLDPARSEGEREAFCRKRIAGTILDYLRRREGHDQVDERAEQIAAPGLPRDQQIELAQGIATLEPLERHVIDCLYWHDMTSEEVGKLVGASGRWVREIETRALARLHSAIETGPQLPPRALLHALLRAFAARS
jgi:RNA polymerase sigma factor (sigma-70 family)